MRCVEVSGTSGSNICTTQCRLQVHVAHSLAPLPGLPGHTLVVSDHCQCSASGLSVFPQKLLPLDQS